MPEKRVGFFLINNLIYDITTNVSGYIAIHEELGVLGIRRLIKIAESYTEKAQEGNRFSTSLVY